jgi:hypothetical protein
MVSRRDLQGLDTVKAKIVGLPASHPASSGLCFNPHQMNEVRAGHAQTLIPELSVFVHF